MVASTILISFVLAASSASALVPRMPYPEGTLSSSLLRRQIQFPSECQTTCTNSITSTQACKTTACICGSSNIGLLTDCLNCLEASPDGAATGGIATEQAELASINQACANANIPITIATSGTGSASTSAAGSASTSSAGSASTSVPAGAASSTSSADSTATAVASPSSPETATASAGPTSTSTGTAGSSSPAAESGNPIAKSSGSVNSGSSLPLAVIVGVAGVFAML